jgi:hypothetical protein
LAAVAFETPLGFERRLRAVPAPANTDIEPWEVHSELVLVSPEVYKRALDLLPERDPDAFLARPRDTSFEEAHHTASLPVAVLGYTLWRLAETARSALMALATVVVLALLSELLH